MLSTQALDKQLKKLVKITNAKFGHWPKDGFKITNIKNKNEKNKKPKGKGESPSKKKKSNNSQP